MTEVRFDLPYPLSVNGLYYNHRNGGRSASQAHRIWRMEAMQEICRQRVKLHDKEIAGHYALHLIVQRPATKRRCDLGNLEKCVSDVLVKMRVVEDDSLADKITLEWGDVAGCRVTVTAVQ